MYRPQKKSAHVYKSVRALLHTAAPESKMSCSRWELSSGEKDKAQLVKASGSNRAMKSRVSSFDGYNKVRTCMCAACAA